MSCKDCEKKPIDMFVCIGDGNVEVIGCEKHIKMLLERVIR